MKIDQAKWFWSLTNSGTEPKTRKLGNCLEETMRCSKSCNGMRKSKDSSCFKSDIDFLPSAVANRVTPKENENNEAQLISTSTSSLADPMAQNDKNVIGDVEDRNSKSVFKSPEEFRGFPKCYRRCRR
ncbi:hypothetical protein QE152_g32648 [Popillia japonica]|uniref:Uncharacterized protein n=1 Tax=Popillia japonica TaxID=7064 RepID=A0AAW1IYD2_POPJA